MLIFRFIILLWIANLISLCALMLKKHLNYLILLGLKRSVLALVSLRLQSLF